MNKMEDKNKIAELEEQVDQVTEIMKNNVTQALKRGENLNEMEMRAANLEETAGVFHVTTKKVSRKMYWEDKKWFIIGGSIGVLVIFIFIGSLFL